MPQSTMLAGSGTGSAVVKSYRSVDAEKSGVSGSWLCRNVPVAVPLPTTEVVNSGGTSEERVKGLSGKPTMVPENVNGAVMTVVGPPATVMDGVVNVAVIPSTHTCE